MDNKFQVHRLDSAQLSDKTKQALIQIIRENAVDGKPFKLPNEDELSHMLGVSRNVLRDALMSLEEIGCVTRRRSKGTIANPQIVNTNSRLDIEPELFTMIKEEGFSVHVETHRLGFVFEQDPAFDDDQDSYLNVEKVFYADDRPVAYCVDHLAGNYAKNAEGSILLLKDLSHYKFLEQYCHTCMAYTMANVDAILPEKWLADTLQISQMDPVLRMDDYAYNYDHEVVVHSNIYFRQGILKLKFLRKSWYLS